MKGTFEIERVFNAKRSEVWRALTEKDLMKQWYFDLPEFREEVGFVFEFTGGKEGGAQYLHRCEIIEVAPGQKLVHTWTYVGYPGISHVAFELSDEGDGTRLKLTHSGLDTFPTDIPDFDPQNFAAGWTMIIGTSLKAFLESEK